MKKKPTKKVANKAKKPVSKTPVITGWKCPCCGSGNAPDVKQCPCAQKKKDSDDQARNKMLRDFFEEQRKAREREPYRTPFPWIPREVPQWHTPPPPYPYSPNPDIWC